MPESEAEVKHNRASRGSADAATASATETPAEATAGAPEKVPAEAPAAIREDVLEIDAHTMRDLEIFEADPGGKSLYQLCNLARTETGALALRRRMASPWCSAERIRATQMAVRFVTKHRDVFRSMPTAFATGSLRHYTREALPIITDENSIEFGLAAMSLRADHVRDYHTIVRGVRVASGMVQGLRKFMARSEFAGDCGELRELLDEIAALMSRPRLAAVPQDIIPGWRFFRILRLDQVFRVHEKSTLARMLQLTGEIDALVAMADANERYGFTEPELLEGAVRVRGEDVVHPLLESPVPNPLDVNQDRRVVFLTGPNMAGKTTYLRAVATALYLGHLGMGVPARTFSFVPMQGMFSSLLIGDNLHGGISYFRAEALRVKAVAEALAAGSRVVVLMDEPFKGTNVKDALDASLAVLERFAARDNCLFLFSSHLIELKDHMGDETRVDCRCFVAEESGERLRFDYVLREGVSSQRLGMRVLQEEGVFKLLDQD